MTCMLFPSTKHQKTICGQSYQHHTTVSLITKCKSVEYVTDINKIYTTGERASLFLLSLPLPFLSFFLSFFLSLNKGKLKSHHHLSWWSSTPCKTIRLAVAAAQSVWTDVGDAAVQQCSCHALHIQDMCLSREECHTFEAQGRWPSCHIWQDGHVPKARRKKKYIMKHHV